MNGFFIVVSLEVGLVDLQEIRCPVAYLEKKYRIM
jgi:hypothetical protein